MGFRVFWLFLKQYLFWLGIFIICRTIFLLYNIDEINNASLGEVLLSYIYGLKLDHSTALYILGFPFLLLFLQSLIKWKGFSTINKYYSWLFLLIALLITTGELPLYDEWHVKLNFKALSHFSHPSEVFRTAEWKDLLVGFGFMLLILIPSAWFYKRYINESPVKGKRKYLASILFFIAIPPFIGIGIRGGLQQIPLQQSDAYYSDNNFLNLTAVNSQWNLVSSIEKNLKFKNHNPFVYMPMERAATIIDSLYETKCDSTISILKTKRPNVVILILESFSGDLLKPLGGYDSLAPRMDSLVGQGILFTNAYANGTLSDQGIANILGGYPAIPQIEILNLPEKYDGIPCIAKDLKSIGYHTSFHFGGQLSYGNIKGFIYYNKFDDVFEGKDFPESIPRGKLGVHDEFMLDTWLKHIGTYPEPFMAAAFTMSSHSPYDQPFPEMFPWGDNAHGFINAAYYSDSCIGDFFAKAKKQPWYSNTLFIVVADHSHNSPRKWFVYSKEYRHIPLLLYGDVIVDSLRGTTNPKLCSQVDIASTLLAQLGLDYKKYKWSKNLYNPCQKEFVYYVFDDGVGWIEPGNYFVYDHGVDKYWDRQLTTPDSLQAVQRGKAYLQKLFDEFLNM